MTCIAGAVDGEACDGCGVRGRGGYCEVGDQQAVVAGGGDRLTSLLQQMEGNGFECPDTSKQGGGAGDAGGAEAGIAMHRSGASSAALDA